ncbi:hypothetical protein F7725_019713 [Dissostichus mawsoni]|uniref:Uncharacterized protein n=1 Tax=Dissostichus mawsoni TaxID=36200 RepID=A0A7J5YKI3_DISMA|nr:hypothetical protein F7725_019713 [Dissostichus mawsoni]
MFYLSGLTVVMKPLWVLTGSVTGAGVSTGGTVVTTTTTGSMVVTVVAGRVAVLSALVEVDWREGNHRRWWHCWVCLYEAGTFQCVRELAFEPVMRVLCAEISRGSPALRGCVARASGSSSAAQHSRLQSKVFIMSAEFSGVLSGVCLGLKGSSLTASPYEGLSVQRVKPPVQSKGGARPPPVETMSGEEEAEKMIIIIIIIISALCALSVSACLSIPLVKFTAVNQRAVRQPAYLGRGLEGRVDCNLWHVPVVDVLVAVPHTVDQDDEEGKEDEHEEQQAAGVQREEVIFVRELVQVVLDPGKVGERADGHQAAQSKVKQLVAEKRDEPARIRNGRVSTVQTYSDGSIHHHGTDGEHQQRDGKSHTGILCGRKIMVDDLILQVDSGHVLRGVTATDDGPRPDVATTATPGGVQSVSSWLKVMHVLHKRRKKHRELVVEDKILHSINSQ